MFTIPTSFAIKELLSVQFDQSDSAAQRGQIDQRAVASVSACRCSEQTTRISTIAKTSQIPFCNLICVDHMLAISCLQNNRELHLFLDLLIGIWSVFQCRSGSQSPNLLQSGSLDVLFKATSGLWNLSSRMWTTCFSQASEMESKLPLYDVKIFAFWDDILPQART